MAKKTYTLNVKLENTEIRAVNDIENKFKDKNDKEVVSHHIELMCDVGDNCERVFLKDRNMENLKKYKRGMIGTFMLRIDVEEDFGLKTKITVVDFIQ